MQDRGHVKENIIAEINELNNKINSIQEEINSLQSKLKATEDSFNIEQQFLTMTLESIYDEIEDFINLYNKKVKVSETCISNPYVSNSTPLDYVGTVMKDKLYRYFQKLDEIKEIERRIYDLLQQKQNYNEHLFNIEHQFLTTQLENLYTEKENLIVEVGALKSSNPGFLYMKRFFDKTISTEKIKDDIKTITHKYSKFTEYFNQQLLAKKAELENFQIKMLVLEMHLKDVQDQELYATVSDLDLQVYSPFQQVFHSQSYYSSNGSSIESSEIHPLQNDSDNNNNSIYASGLTLFDNTHPGVNQSTSNAENIWNIDHFNI